MGMGRTDEDIGRRPLLALRGREAEGQVRPDVVQAGLALLHDKVVNKFKGLLA